MSRSLTGSLIGTLTRHSLLALLGLAMCVPMVACSKNAATGRSQFLAMSREEEIALGEEAQPELTEQYGGAVTDPAINAYLTDIGQALAAQTEADNPSLPWEFTLLDDDIINAFALPGGKVFLSRGLAEKMTNEAQLAAVVGHEIGHVTARHSNERFGQQLGLGIGGAVLGAVIGGVIDSDNGVGIGAGIGGTVGGIAALSYSRDQEIEADRLGMRYMERLGYDPRGAIQVQEILGEASKGQGRPPEILSTHPLSSTRIRALEKRFEKYYQHTVNNPAYQLYPERYQQRMLSRLNQMARGLSVIGNAVLASADDEFGGLGPAHVWCGHCRAAHEH